MQVLGDNFWEIITEEFVVLYLVSVRLCSLFNFLRMTAI